MNRVATEQSTRPAKHTGYASLDDESLMLLVQSANHDAFAELVQRHTANLLNLAKRTVHSSADAEDVVQAVFIKLWQRPHNWQPDKSSLSTWLFRVVLNACYDQSRARTRRTVAESQVEESLKYQSPDVLDQIDLQQQADTQHQSLLLAITDLPESQRDAINLAVFVGLPQKQVASILGVSLKAVESLLSRAKAKLKLNVAQQNKEGADQQLGV